MSSELRARISRAAETLRVGAVELRNRGNVLVFPGGPGIDPDDLELVAELALELVGTPDVPIAPV